MMKNVVRKKNLIITSGILLVVLVATIGIRYVLLQLNQPVTVTLTPGPETKAQNDYQIDLTPKLEAGKYVSFSYPAGLTARPTQAVAPYVESFYYTARASDVESWALAISVSTLPAGDLANSSGFMLRKNNPDKYLESHETVNGMPITIMTDHTAGFSKIAYIQHNSLLATVSLIGNHAASVQPLQISFDTVLKSWQWLR